MEADMSHTKKLPYLLAAGLVVGAIFISACSQKPTPTSAVPDDIAIEKTLRTYLEIEAEALYTLDDSRLVDVLANDPRGGLVGGEELNKRYLQAVQWYKGNPNLKGDEIGCLEARQAFYAFRRQAKQIYDDAVAQGRLTAPDQEDLEKRLASYKKEISISEDQPTPEIYLADIATGQLETLPEYKALLAATGYDGFQLPHPLPDQIVPQAFVIESITVDRDLAHVVGDFSHAKVELTFAKIDGRWYLIGQRTIQNHAG
jgi:hypothetical protein